MFEVKRRGYEAGVFYAIGRNKKKINQCGYKLETDFNFFKRSDKLAAKEQAEKLAAGKPWIVFGPRRSSHFILATKGLPGTPLVSPMANATNVAKLDPPFFSMSHSLEELSEASIFAIRKQGFGTRYGSIVSGTCQFCRSLAKVFNKIAAENDLKRVFSVFVDEENIDFKTVLNKIQESNIDFIHLPNYSMLSGKLMLEIHKKYPKLRYLGGDGWGASMYSFIETQAFKMPALGISARTGAPAQKAESIFSIFSLGRYWEGNLVSPPPSSIYIIEFFDQLVKDLCERRPGTREEFIHYLKAKPKDYFRSKTGISVYLLGNNRFQYDYSYAK
jgi:thiol-disulfide isomerase/thioredoxin